jgi:signal transduction histidine kinase
VKRVAGPAVIGGVVLLTVTAALVVAERMMGAPRGDVEQLALFLTGSGLGSMLILLAAVAWASHRLGSLRRRLIFAFGAGLLVVLANILTTSALMFLNAHDLSLLFLLLAFAAVISLTFGVAVASTLTADLEVLGRVASRLAQGDLAARVKPHGSDEVARVGEAFDRMAERLEAAFDRQQMLEASRRELVAAVSHDLRTPLSTTRAMVEALADGVVAEPSEVRRYLGLMHREIQHLTRLIDDLFELSQIESGAIALQLAEVDLLALASETVAAYEAQAHHQDIQLSCHVRSDLPAVHADAARLQRVLRNLIDNAMRHTPGGGQVRLAVESADGTVMFSVDDSGPGVAADERERIFDRFYRGERSRNRGEHAAGAGLGLAIARGLIEAHGGRIWAAASPLGGATFHFSVPATRQG